MVVNLSPETQRLIEERMKAGGFHSPEDLILAAIASLDDSEMFVDYAPGELNALVEEAEESYRKEGGLTREQVFDPIYAKLAQQRRKE